MLTQSYGSLTEYDMADEITPVITTMTEAYFSALAPNQIEDLIERDYMSETVYIVTTTGIKVRAKEFFKSSYVN